MTPRCFPSPSIFRSFLSVYRHCCEARSVCPTALAAAAAPLALLVDVELALHHNRLPSPADLRHNEASVDTSHSSVGPKPRLLPSSWASFHKGRRVLSFSSPRRVTMSSAACRMHTSGSGQPALEETCCFYGSLV